MNRPRLELLQKMAIFGALTADSIEFILERINIVELERGQYFFREADEGTNMYVLEKGRVEVLKRWQGEELKLAELGPGDCFGEMALMEIANRNASCKALEPCVALEISNGVLFQLYEHSLEQFTLIQMNMGREVSRRLRLADTRIFQTVFGANSINDANYLYFI